MRSKFLFVFILIIFSIQQVSGEDKISGYIELEGVVERDDEIVPYINFYAKGPLKGIVGWTTYIQSSRDWREGLVGLTLAPSPWIEFSGSIGMETDDNPLRGMATTWIGGGKWSLLSIQEYGGSGHWQQNIGKYHATRNFAFGAIKQAFIGTGPYVETTFGKFLIWGTYAPVDKKGIVTLRFNF